MSTKLTKSLLIVKRPKRKGSELDTEKILGPNKKYLGKIGHCCHWLSRLVYTLMNLFFIGIMNIH